jgi:hypothetical protein
MLASKERDAGYDEVVINRVKKSHKRQNHKPQTVMTGAGTEWLWRSSDSPTHTTSGGDPPQRHLSDDPTASIVMFVPSTSNRRGARSVRCG